ncbi:MAG TPA: hypothetical protein VHF88_09270 [Thermoleophilaceae bacterium]|nr:hypothetical protein [Thermoleophilaceae bacterium]
MSETERPGGPGDEEHEVTDKPYPTPDDVPRVGELGDDPDEGGDEEQGPEVDQLDEDPAYNPDDPGLKGLKGG